MFYRWSNEGVCLFGCQFHDLLHLMSHWYRSFHDTNSLNYPLHSPYYLSLTDIWGVDCLCEVTNYTHHGGLLFPTDLWVYLSFICVTWGLIGLSGHWSLILRSGNRRGWKNSAFIYIHWPLLTHGCCVTLA